MDRCSLRGRSILYSGDVVMHHAWQTRERRRATRWSYGYGIGAMSGLRLGRRDGYGWRMLASYSKMHLREMLREARRGDWNGVQERRDFLKRPGPEPHLRSSGGTVQVGKVTERG